MSKKRIEWVDISKGIAIILMIIGHSGIPQFLNNWIYSFHMPFFFFISGVLSKQVNQIGNTNSYNFIIHKCKTLLVPFLIYSLINIILYPLYGDLSLGNYLIQLFHKGWEGIALWFIPVFFLSVCISYLCSTNKKTLLFTMLITLMAGIIFSKYKIKLPYALATVPIGSFYIISGKLLQKKIFYIINKTKIFSKITLISVGATISFAISTFYRLDLAGNQIQPIVPLLIASLGGILLICIISKILEKTYFTRGLSFIGKHTFEIMAFSQVIIILTNKYVSNNIIVKYSI